MTATTTIPQPAYFVEVQPDEACPDFIPALLRKTAQALRELGEIDILAISFINLGFRDDADDTVFKVRIVFLPKESSS